MSILNKNSKLCIVGLGYVGLPLVVEFSKHVKVSAYDISTSKIDLLRQGIDPNGEIETGIFDPTDIYFTSDIAECADCTFFIVAVPTPITKNNVPDLFPLKSATTAIGKVMKKGDLIVFESTVYPGCTEEICKPILESQSGLYAGIDFKIGYSPERINPGDKIHTLTNTIKIVSGEDAETLDAVAQLYELIIDVGVYRAETIKVAEAAKLIENVQRDLNIALMNELSLIFDRLDIDTRSVIDAAGSKWNFSKFYPGLVGGHCISVDPYYLTYKAQEVGYYPEVILSGRTVNDNLSQNVAKKVIQMIGAQGYKLNESRILVMGITFKENVSDIRNSKVIDLVKDIMSYHIEVDIVDPHASPEEFKSEIGLTLQEEVGKDYNCVIVAVQHEEYKLLDEKYFLTITKNNATLIDIKGIYRKKITNMDYWTL